MKKYRTSSFTDENELINLTPLLDVLFVILILFILVAPMLNLEEIKLTESSSKDLTPISINNQHSLNIYLHSDNTISVNEKMITQETLKILLDQIQENKPAPVPRLFVDKNSSFGMFTETKNLIEESGFKSLDLVIKNKE